MSFKSHNKPIRFKEDAKERLGGQSLKLLMLLYPEHREIDADERANPSFESDVGASWRRLYRCLCMLFLLDGGESLEEFGQVNL